VDQFMVSVLGKSGSVYDERKQATVQKDIQPRHIHQSGLLRIFFMPTLHNHY